MKNKLRTLILKAVNKVCPNADIRIEIDIPANPTFGDFSTNVALTLARVAKKSPIQLARDITAAIQDTDAWLGQVSIAGPGFINFTIKPQQWIEGLKNIHDQGSHFGISESKRGSRALVEFVSANPTGPLHIGHGRNAVVGDTLARLLTAVGYQVEREYYVNDGGIQITTLGKSVYFRLREIAGEKTCPEHSRRVEFPQDAYQGEYIADIAKEVMIRRSEFSHLSSEDQIQYLGRYAGDKILDEISADLKNIAVVFDRYFYESSLYKEGKVEDTLKELNEKNLSYQKDEALWLNSTQFGDDKDRVLIKKDGSFTYLTPDIAYHRNKFKRGYDLMINIWGADHAGYVPRLKAGLKGLGLDTDRLHVVLIQMVSLIKAGELLSMSTRRAQYETLEAVVKAVGPDVARYFFMMRSYQAQLEFDLELARKHSSENPVYYIQYAHARICSIFAKAGASYPPFDEKYLNELILPEEIGLARLLQNYPEIILKASDELAPHRVATYLLDLAREFQSYYDRARSDAKYRVLGGSEMGMKAKLYLLGCIRQVLQNGLTVLGISAPESM